MMFISALHTADSLPDSDQVYARLIASQALLMRAV